MSHFYLTLPSNSSMKTYPNNTVAKYVTQLQNRIELDGDWEVGLIEVMYPNNWANVIGQSVSIFIDGMNKAKVDIPDDYYSSIDALFDKFKGLVYSTLRQHKASLDMKLVKAKNDKGEDETYITIRNTYEKLIAFEVSSGLAKILGLESYDMDYLDGINYNFESSRIDMKFGGPLNNLFVYCDVVEHVPVGDTAAPLLRCLNIKGKRGEGVCSAYDSPIYVPVQKKSFETVEVNIMIDTGEPVPFTGGRSLITLHFRRATNPYFISK